MRYLFILFILIGCSKEDFKPTVESLKGTWEIKQIEVRDNLGSHILADCKVPNNYAYSAFYIDIIFQSEEVAVFDYACFPNQNVVSWVLQGNEINFYSGGSSLKAKILLAEADAMILQMDFSYNPLYYYKKK